MEKSATKDPIPDAVVEKESKALFGLFKAAKPGSQAKFGTEFGIGSQGMVWQYLHGHRPLNLVAAMGFSKGLNTPISVFSVRLAEIAMEAAALSGGMPAFQTSATKPKMVKLLPFEQQLLLLFRGLNDGHKETVIMQANQLHTIDNPGRSAANPFANAGTPGTSIAPARHPI